ncbi:MAG: hypothetical protein QOG64_614 [Acidimicrobiaceae bacterium]|jgi:SAM-dependent methyltransferase|nr:hypothetical protein [Acidimicrobiaceae bacterium]
MADHPIYAAVYDRVNRPVEQAGLARRRERLLAGATGRVLEVGGGTGANLPYYRDVESVDVLEPDGAMRRRLSERLAALAPPVPVEVHATDLDGARFGDRSFDAIVCTLVLCSVPDLAASFRILRRLLRPDGRLLFLEHVRAQGARAGLQRLATPLWSRVVPGCHLDRDPLAVMRLEGFVVTDCERFTMPLGNALIGAAVQGAARVVEGRAA